MMHVQVGDRVVVQYAGSDQLMGSGIVEKVDDPDVHVRVVESWVIDVPARDGRYVRVVEAGQLEVVTCHKGTKVHVINE